MHHGMSSWHCNSHKYIPHVHFNSYVKLLYTTSCTTTQMSWTMHQPDTTVTHTHSHYEYSHCDYSHFSVSLQSLQSQTVLRYTATYCEIAVGPNVTRVFDSCTHRLNGWMNSLRSTVPEPRRLYMAQCGCWWQTWHRLPRCHRYRSSEKVAEDLPERTIKC